MLPYGVRVSRTSYGVSKYVNIVLNVHRTIRLIRDGEEGGRGM